MARARTPSQARLLHALLAQGAEDSTYRNLAEVTGVSPRTVAALMAEMRDLGFVRTSPAALGDGWGWVLSVAIGTETCRAGLVDANGVLHPRARSEAELEPEQLKLPPKVLLRRVTAAVKEVLQRADGDPELEGARGLRLLGLATAWACPVRGSKRAAGTVMHPDWAELSAPTLPAAVATATGFPLDRVHAVNDANAHLLAAIFDEGRWRAREGDEERSRIALLLRIGGGIGASTMIVAPHRRSRLSFVDSIMLGGARSLAGELAHLPIEPSIVQRLNERASWVDGLAPLSTGWKCSCGQEGHLEALAGGAGWIRRMEESEIEIKPLLEGLDRYDTDQIDEKLKQLEDLRVMHALEDVGRLVGRSLASPILLLDPHSLFLTGSFAVEPVVRGIAEREAWRHVFGDALTVTPIRGRDSRFLGVRGGALAVFRSQVYRRFEDWLRDPSLADRLTFSPD
jgi:predicted NBD/HSP70 family sugar kinase